MSFHKDRVIIVSFLLVIVVSVLAIGFSPKEPQQKKISAASQEQYLRSQYLSSYMGSESPKKINSVLAIRNNYGKISREKGDEAAREWAKHLIDKR